MKEAWEYKKLNEVCNNVSNIRWKNVPPDAVFSYVDLSSVNRETSIITETQTINSLNAPSRAKQIIQQNDILFGTTRPTLRRVCIVDENNNGNICSTGFCVLRPKTEIVSSKWVFYQLLSEKYYAYIEPLQSGATYPAVTDNVVKSYVIPIPPLSEQQHIIEELDLLSSIIEKKKAQLNELDNLAQSLFNEFFGYPSISSNGWGMKKMSDVCILKSGNSDANNSLSGDLAYVKVGDMNIEGNETFITTSSTYVDRMTNARNIFPIGTVIFPKRGGAILTNKKRLTKIDICCDLNVMGVIPNIGLIHPLYLFFYFLKIDFSRFANTGSTIPQINNYDVAPMDIVIPPMEIQYQFAERVETIERQKELIKKSIKEVETLFNSRMDYYFN